MSDDEYYSDNNSENEDSDNESEPSTNKKPLFKPSVAIKSYGGAYDDIDDSEPDDHRTWRGRVVAEPRQKFSRVSVQVYLLCIVTDF